MYQIWQSRGSRSAPGTLWALRLPGDNSSLLMLWTLVNDYNRWKRMWLTTFPKDFRIKFRSLQVRVWSRASLSYTSPRSLHISARAFQWVLHWSFCSFKFPIVAFFCPHHSPPHFTQIRSFLPGFRCPSYRLFQASKEKQETQTFICILFSPLNSKELGFFLLPPATMTGVFFPK